MRSLFPSEQDVCPPERRDMRQQIGRTIQAGPLPRGHGLNEVLGVPVDDDCREQVEARHAVVLALGGAIPDFTLAPDAQAFFKAWCASPLFNPT